MQDHRLFFSPYFPFVLVKNLRYAYPLATGLLLSSCALYAPTVPTTPLLTRGQVQLTAGLRGLNAVEAGAAWAPTDHLLLTAESALQSSTTTETTNNVTTTYPDYHRQASLGLGYYQAPTDRLPWHRAAVAGVGLASVNLYSIDFAVPSVFFPFPLPYVSGFFEARYRRYYGQLYAARPLGPGVQAGASLRGTWVDYTKLTFDGQPLSPTNHFFLEPTLFVQVGQGVVQGLGTLGLSLPTHREAGNPLSKRTSPVSGLVSVGVVFRPDLLRRRK